MNNFILGHKKIHVRHIFSTLALIYLVTMSQGTNFAIFWRHDYIIVVYVCLVLSAVYGITSNNMK